ncbi:unnamed protein product [Hydatigera taeniaeformis]|uniref:HDNR domain-containing protein n=1 Tax=Hydatigena taeniaeformis TaxID=6205 RepID=A0A0R3WI26_HYDTA|nr:unnamed protein product [Hydatigera taeniaeformis]
MPSNVELKCTPLPSLVDSSDIDPFTQRPRTYKGPRGGSPVIFREQCRNAPGPLFNEVKPVKDMDHFHRVSYTHKVPRSVLYHTDGPDFIRVGSRFEPCPEAQHDGAPYGAAIQWPPYRAGSFPEYWERSMLPINHHGLLVFPSTSKTLHEYQEEDARNVAYVKQLKVPTEYQERYIARIPVPHRQWN